MSLRASFLASVTFLLSGTACGGSNNNEGSATMRPGENCLGCHTHFTAAGTVYASVAAAAGEGVGGVTVTIDDDVHSPIHLTTNAAGNFYTTSAITFPASVTVTMGDKTMRMNSSWSGGGCASCHDGSQRVHVP